MKKLKVNKSVLIFLMLHTVVVSFFIYILTEGGIPLPLLAVCAAVFAGLITVYTARKISRHMTREISEGLKAISLASILLKTMSESMHDNAKTLERNAAQFYSYAAEADSLLKKAAAPGEAVSESCVQQPEETDEAESG